MLARGDDDAAARTGLNVDVRIDAALADELEAGQAFEQVGLNPRALADEHQTFGILEPRRERVGILHVVVKDRNLVPLELLEAGKRAQRVEIIVENRNLHACVPRVDALARAPDWVRDLTHSRSRGEPATAAAQVAVRPRKPEKAGAIERFEPRGPSFVRLRCWNGARSFLFNCVPRRM